MLVVVLCIILVVVLMVMLVVVLMAILVVELIMLLVVVLTGDVGCSADCGIRFIKFHYIINSQSVLAVKFVTGTMV